MGFHEVQFPSGISYGSTGGPGYMTTISEVDGGHEPRVGRWSQARRQYNVAFGIKTSEDLAALNRFYIARQGALFGFRYKDWQDYTSKENGYDTPTFADQELGAGNGSQVVFQLIKKYTDGGVSRTRTIAKPVASTTLVALDGVNQTSGWTVNTTSGIITFDTAPGSGVVVTAGYQFDTPVRFGKEADRWLALTFDAFHIGSAPSIMLVELVDAVAVSGEFYYGGAAATCIVSSYTLSAASPRVLSLNPSVAGTSVFLPVIETIPQGGPVFYIAHLGSVYTVDLKTSTGSVVKTMEAGYIYEVLLGSDGTNPVWIVR